MSGSAFFVLPDGRLRAPWRVVAFIAVLVAVGAALAVVAGPFVVRLFRAIDAPKDTAESWLDATALLITTWISLRLIDKRPWSDAWLGADAKKPGRLVVGFLLGAFAIGLPIVVLIGGGWLREQRGISGSWWIACFKLSLLLLPAALTEELLTRGYLFAVLRESWGWVCTALATSVGFGLLHLGNPGVTAEAIVMVMLAGLFLSAVLFATRSVYAAWMAHFAWNWTMAVVFHAAVSGIPFDSPGYRFVDAGPDWATGGLWGPEAGVPAALGMIAATTLLVSRRSPRWITRWFE